MRTSRILSLLFSLTQFILVLKLIEFVRGEDSEQGLENRAPRHFFVAPNIQKRKKNRPWLTTSTTTTEDTFYSIETATESNYNFTGENEFNHTTSYIDRIGIIDVDRNNSLSSNSTSGVKIKKIKRKNGHGDGETITSSSVSNSNENMARLCPACANGECTGTVQGTGFPILAVGAAIAAAIIWFFVFLWIIKFWDKKKDTSSSGYGYGSSSYSSGQPLPSLTYNTPTQMARYMNSFLGSEEFNTMSKFVLGALDKIYS